jgi:hypothetical protein
VPIDREIALGDRIHEQVRQLVGEAL